MLVLSFMAMMQQKAKNLDILYYQDQRYYNVEMDRLGEAVTQIALIVNIAQIPVHFIVGYLFDAVNTRLVVFIGQTLLIACIFLFPWGHSLYPGALLFEMGIAFSSNLSHPPLIVDHVDNRTKGLAFSYSAIAEGIGGIYSSFFVMQIVESYDLLYGTIVVGATLLLFSLYLLCNLKNTLTLKRERRPPPVRGNCCKRFFHSMWGAWIFCWSHKAFLLLLVGKIVTNFVIHSGTTSALLWASKYIYIDDGKAKAAHSKYLGIASYFDLGLALMTGLLFDKAGPRFLIVATLGVGGGALMWLYFVGPLDSILALTLQISVGVIANQGSHFINMTMA